MILPVYNKSDFNSDVPGIRKKNPLAKAVHAIEKVNPDEVREVHVFADKEGVMHNEVIFQTAPQKKRSKWGAVADEIAKKGELTGKSEEANTGLREFKDTFFS